MNIKINYKDNKAFTTADIIVAIIIIVLFSSIIATAYYNYYLSVTAKNRNAIATNCVIDVIENIEMMNYDEVTTITVNSKIQELYENKTLPEQYTLTATLEKYNETAGNTDKKDIIKILTVKAQYKVAKKDREIEIKRLIIK